MHTIQVYIDETLDAKGLADIREDLLAMPHVEHVMFNSKMPHDVLVEYEEHHVLPLDIVHTMHSRGIHTDIISG